MLFDIETWKALAKECGFTHAEYLEVKTIVLKKEVRDTCAGNSCGQYGKWWSCPPGCGELSELQEKLSSYNFGLLVQTVGELEDPFDIDSMMETEKRHKANISTMYAKIKESYLNGLALGAGCCSVCKTCTYPDVPCRFPERQMVSMEACGIVVSEVCQANGMKYHHGSGTITYTGCFLLK